MSSVFAALTCAMAARAPTATKYARVCFTALRYRFNLTAFVFKRIPSRPARLSLGGAVLAVCAKASRSDLALVGTHDGLINDLDLTIVREAIHGMNSPGLGARDILRGNVHWADRSDHGGHSY